MTPEAKGRWSSRKFWSATVWGGVFTALLVLGHLEGGIYLQLMALTIGGYYLSNVWQKGKTPEVPK